MTNRHVLELLDDFIDGELKPAEREAVKDHLKNCSSCLSDFEEANKLIANLNSIESGDPGDDYHRETRELIFSRTIGSGQTEIFSNEKLTQTKLTFYKSLAALAASILLLSVAMLIDPDNPMTFANDIKESRQLYETASLREIMLFEKNDNFTEKEKKDLARAMLMQMPTGILGRAAILSEIVQNKFTGVKIE